MRDIVIYDGTSGKSVEVARFNFNKGWSGNEVYIKGARQLQKNLSLNMYKFEDRQRFLRHLSGSYVWAGEDATADL